MKGWGWPSVDGPQQHQLLCITQEGSPYRAVLGHSVPVRMLQKHLVSSAMQPQAQLAADTGASWLLCLGATTNSPQITCAQISSTLE